MNNGRKFDYAKCESIIFIAKMGTNNLLKYELSFTLWVAIFPTFIIPEYESFKPNG